MPNMKRLLLSLLVLSTGSLVVNADETSLASTPTPTPTITPCSSPTAVFGENFDTVTPPTLPTEWVATNAVDPDAIVWTSSNSGTPLPPADSLSNAAFCNDPATVSDKRLESPMIPIWNPFAQLTFRNNFNLENTFDGGVLDVSVNGGAFTDILAAGGSFVTGGYSGSISTIFSNPIGGRMAWTGNSGGFHTTTVNLPTVAAGQMIKVRWRMGSDTSVSAQGWRIDNVVVYDCPQPVTVSLPIDSFDNSVPISTVFIEPVVTTYLHPGLGYTGFQGSFIFDSAVVSFASPRVVPAGVTSGGWSIGTFVQDTGPGTIKTLLVSALYDGTTPLVGSGTLFNLRMVRVSGFPGTSSPLTWAGFDFLDQEFEAHSPDQANGLISIVGTGPTPTPSPVPTPSPSPSPMPTPSPSPTPGPPITVSLPIDSFDNALPISTVFIEPVTTTMITASLNYTFFQGDFTFDSAIAMPSPAGSSAQPAGLTATGGAGWTVGSNVLNTGPGTLKTLRISAFSNDGITPLNGSGTLFNVRMLRVSGFPGTSTPLTWAASPSDFEFADTDLNSHSPNQNNGLITISGTAPTPTPTPVPTPSPSPTPVITPPPPTPTGTPAGPVKVSLPTFNFDTSAPISTVISAPVVTTFISTSLDYRGFQADVTFDSAIAMPSPAGSSAQAAGLTATGGAGWTVGSNVLNTGPGTLKTLRISAFANDWITPLNGAGTLFIVRWRRVSNFPGNTPLTWSASPNDFEFIDGDLNSISPNQNNGLITITGPSPTPTPTPLPINISGSIRNCASPGSDPVPGATLTLTGTVSASAASDASGNYAFSSLPGGGSYVVTPSKGALAPGTGSINIVDVIAAQRHFLNIELLSGCRLKAADVNGDNLINNVDMTAILRFSLGNPAANVGKYRFTPVSRTYSAVLSNQTGQNFDGIFVGDVASPFSQ